MYTIQVICHKCNGSGYLEAYKHINNGICYTCSGTGLISQLSETYTPTPDPKQYYAEYVKEILAKQEESKLFYERRQQLRDLNDKINGYNNTILFMINMMKTAPNKDELQKSIDNFKIHVENDKAELERLKIEYGIETW